MNLVKFLVVVAALVAVYFAFFTSDLPREIDSAVAFIEKSPDPMPAGFRGASETFSELQSLSF